LKTIAIDFETFYSRKLKYTLTTSIAETYCQSPHFDAYMVAASDGVNTWVGHPRDFNWTTLAGNRVIAHNCYFEKTVVKELERRKLIPEGTFASVAEWHCTANMGAYLTNLRKLDSVCEKLLGVKVDKSARGDANNKHWPQDFSAAEQKAMLEYARKDAHLCWTLWDKFSMLWPEHERKLSQLSIDAGMRGVQIDRELLDKYIIDSHAVKLSTENLLPWITGAEDDDEEIDSWEGFNKKPTSTKCIAEQCR